jgi:ribosomal protein L40E
MTSQPAAPRQCPTCGRELPPGQDNCAFCAATLSAAEPVVVVAADAPAPPTPCPGCGAPLAAAAVICIACGFDRRKGRRLETVHAAPPRRKRRRAGGSGMPASYFVWLLGAWGLIALGLACILSGIFLIWMHSFLDRVALEQSGRFSDPWGMPQSARASRDRAAYYVPTAVTMVLGVAFIYVGARLRPARPEARSAGDGKKAGSKQICPECGGRSPANAHKCYRCGHTFSGSEPDALAAGRAGAARTPTAW